MCTTNFIPCILIYTSHLLGGVSLQKSAFEAHFYSAITVTLWLYTRSPQMIYSKTLYLTYPHIQIHVLWHYIEESEFHL